MQKEWAPKVCDPRKRGLEKLNKFSSEYAQMAQRGIKHTAAINNSTHWLRTAMPLN